MKKIKKSRRIDISKIADPIVKDMPAGIVAPIEGPDDVKHAPVMICPECHGMWFEEIIQYRIVTGTYFSALTPLEDVWKQKTRRARIVVCQCRFCGTLVRPPQITDRGECNG
jgi:hypothetical protein